MGVLSDQTGVRGVRDVETAVEARGIKGAESLKRPSGWRFSTTLTPLNSPLAR
jgi:hypothetical protein